MKDDFYLIVANYLETGVCPHSAACPVTREYVDLFKGMVKTLPRKKVDMTFVTHCFIKDMKTAMGQPKTTEEEMAEFRKYAEDAEKELEEKGGEDFWEVYDLESMPVDEYDEFMDECMLPNGFGLSGDVLSFEIYKVSQANHETV